MAITSPPPSSGPARSSPRPSLERLGWTVKVPTDATLLHPSPEPQDEGVATSEQDTSNGTGGRQGLMLLVALLSFAVVGTAVLIASV